MLTFIFKMRPALKTKGWGSEHPNLPLPCVLLNAPLKFFSSSSMIWTTHDPRGVLEVNKCKKWKKFG